MIVESIFILGLSLILTVIFGKFVIKKLKELKYGQSIRKEGPEAHLQKTGTPTMGGILFLGVFFLGILFIKKFNYNFFIVLIATYGLGIIGFIDDYKIIKYKKNEGLKPKSKLLGQIIIAFCTSVIAFNYLGSDLFIPIFNKFIDIGYLMIFFNTFFILALTNSVNLTDGLDGLSTSVTIVVAMFFLVVSIILNELILVKYIIIMIGCLLGFLYYNWNPAKVFMGDVGSLALGGFIASIAIILKLQLIIPIVGIIYFIETLSVIIQVFYYKKYKKRVFRMTPIHHHFELGGLSEKQIVWRFVVVTIISSLISIYIL